MYTYLAYVTKVYDGDTITVDFDLGLNIILKDQTIRLYGIDTPELRGSERETGLISRDFVRELILNKSVIIKTHKDSKGKYGRWLGEVYLFVDDDTVCINDKLLELGYAKKYK